MNRKVTRRQFLAFGGAALAGAALTGSRGFADVGPRALIPLPREGGQFVLPPLPYAFDELEPHLDTQTMQIHHGKHHAAYVKNLNEALAKEPTLGNQPLESLLGNLAAVSETIRATVRNHGGGHYNHALFWEVMRPGGSTLTGPLAAAITASFGSVEKFKEQFSRAAMTRFGSGWAWLVVTPSRTLAVASTPNQDNPLMTGVVEAIGTPILGLDVWEHAYYLKFQNRRADYIDAWWNVVHWDKVAELYQAALRL